MQRPGHSCLAPLKQQGYRFVDANRLSLECNERTQNHFGFPERFASSIKALLKDARQPTLRSPIGLLKYEAAAKLARNSVCLPPRTLVRVRIGDRANLRRARPAGGCAVGQRAGVLLAPDAGLGGGAQGRTGAYPTGPSDAERPCRELPRAAARQMPQRELVPYIQ